MAANPFALAPNPGQFSAIQNGANSNSLVSQLFSSAPKNPANPFATAAASSVKSPNAPANTGYGTNGAPMSVLPSTPTQSTTQATVNQPYVAPSTAPTGAPNQTVVAGPGTAGYTYVNGILTSVGGVPTGNGQTATQTAPVASNPAPTTTPAPTAPANPLATATNGLLASPTQNAALTAQAQAIGTNYGQQIANVGNIGAGMQAGDLSTGTSPVGEGNAAIASEQESNRISALGTAENAALAPINQELTAQSQAQAGLLGAGQLASPNNTNVTPPAGAVTTNALTGQQYSNPIYEPATGAYQAISPQPNGTAGQPATAGQATQYQIKSGDTFNAIAAANGTTAAALEAANPGANPNDLKIGSSITIPASGTGNTAFSGGIAAGQATAGENQVAMQSALAQSRGIAANISTLLQQNPTLNSSPAAIGNAIQQWASSTQVPTGPYVNLLNDLQEYANTIAPVLGVGGAPTDNKTAIATQMVPILASGGTIQQALANLDANAVTKINAVPQAVSNAAAPAQSQSTNTSSSAASTSFSNGQTAAGGTLIFKNGQWVVNQ